MAIDKSGKWWTGTEPEDLNEYLKALTEDGDKTDKFRLCRCECGCTEFGLHFDATEGCARRTCSKCKLKQFICDSETASTSARLRRWKCVECKSTGSNIGIGFSMREDHLNVRWLYVGVRCVTCGVLGCFADWKIGYTPSLQLLDKC